MKPPLVSRIRRLSMDDGPGLRDVVFLKGCRLRCSWCHNPETMRFSKSPWFSAHRCIGCNACFETCVDKAIVCGQPQPRFQFDRCTGCGACADHCPTDAIRMCGEAFSPEDLTRLLLVDKPYFDNSGGGVTFSGGEPALHLSYLSEVCGILKEHGVHLAMETAGDFNLETFEQTVLSYLDLIYYDIKLMDPAAHRRYTGLSNDRILANFEWLVRHSPIEVVPRTPLIPGVTDTADNLRRIETYLRSLGVSGWVKLPFNPACSAERLKCYPSFIAEK